MGSPLVTILSTRIWVDATVLFLLLIYMASAGDLCPPDDKLDPCTCFHDPQMKGLSPTTAAPIEVTHPKPHAEESYGSHAQEGKADFGVKGAIAFTMMTSAPLPPNETCCTIVSCNAPASLLILQDAITNALSRKWVDKLVLSKLPPQKGHTLVRLPKEWFTTFRVKHFEVRDTLLSGDFIHYGSPFAGQEQSMMWFTARNCNLGGSLTYDKFGTVNTKGLNSMTRIEGIDFSRNQLMAIESGFRHPPTNLSTIILSYNSIQTVEGSAFSSVPNLKRLDLSHNLLEYIGRNVFAAPARHLRYIDLSWNHIKVLPNDMFVNLPHLKVVILSNNFLTSMTNQPWAPVWRQLTYIDVSRNFILCDCSLMWLLPILSPPVARASTTPAPVPLPGQVVLGECSYGQPSQNAKLHKFTTLTREHLDC